MIKVSPSILSADFACLGAACREVLDAGADMIHFDVMDGHFVNNISFGLPVLSDLRRALPDAFFDVHLMLTHPLSWVKAFADAGASRVTFHVEACVDVRAAIAAIRGCGCEAGLALNPDTPFDAAVPYLDGLSALLVMGVTPGHGGQAFQPSALDKLRGLRSACEQRGLSPDLSVDGGVKAETTGRQCVEAGATVLVAGSAVFGAGDKAAAVRRFKELPLPARKTPDPR